MHVARRLHVALRAEQARDRRRRSLRRCRRRHARSGAAGAARHRHDVDIDVAVVIAAESNRCSVRREVRPRSPGLRRSSAGARAAITIRDPDVAVVDEGRCGARRCPARSSSSVSWVDGERGARSTTEHAQQREGQQASQLGRGGASLTVPLGARRDYGRNMGCVTPRSISFLTASVNKNRNLQDRDARHASGHAVRGVTTSRRAAR